MPAPPRRQPRIAWGVWVLALVAVGGGVVTAYNELTADDASSGGTTATTVERGLPEVKRRHSEQVAKKGEQQAIVPAGSFPSGYRMTYLVEVAGATTTTEVVTASPPFASRTEIYRGAGTVGELIDERESGFAVLATRSPGQDAVVLRPPPGSAGARPGAALLDAERLGLVERRELREVAGRRCQVWRTGDAEGATPFVAPEGTGFIDLCVDADGLLLEEWHEDDGRGVLQRVATDVDVGPVEAASLEQLAREQTVPAAKGGGSVRRVDPASRPVGDFLEVPAPLAGFELRGRYSVVPPQPELADPLLRSRATASVIDVFVRGADLLVVEVGGVLNQSAPWEPDPRYPDVDLGELLGRGEVLIGTSAAEVRALLPKGRFVRVYGTVDVATLTGVARSLVAVTGDGVLYID